MYKSKQEIRKIYLDHAESVTLSGLGHEHSRSEILGAMLRACREFDEAHEFVPFDQWQRLLSQ